MGKASRKIKQPVEKVSSAEITTPLPQGYLTRPLPALLLVVLLAFVVNVNVLANGFGWDDEQIIKGIRSPEHWWSLLVPNLARDSASKQDAPYYRPVVSASYYLDKAIWGDNPLGFHLSVLLAHLLNTALVFLLARGLITVHSSRHPPYESTALNTQLSTLNLLPLIVASLFAVHPVHAEAVAWIAGRNDVFCTTFVLASFLLYLWFYKTRYRMLFGLSMVSFFLAILTKEMAVGLILMFPLVNYLLGSRSGSRQWQQIGIWLVVPSVILVVYFWMRDVSITMPYGGVSMSTFLSSSAVSVMIRAAGLYVKLVVFPYPHNPFITILPTSPPMVLIVSGLALALFLGGILFALFRRHVLLGIGLVWTLLLLAPAISVAVLNLANTSAAERYLYAPSIGLLMAMVWLILRGVEWLGSVTRWSKRKVWITACLLWVILVTVWGWESWNRNAVWRSHLTFWETTEAVLLGNINKEAIVHNNLGAAYQKAGRSDEAIREYQLALKLKPNYADVHNNLGNIYKDQGRLDEAIKEYQLVLRLQPDSADARYNLGVVYTNLGRWEEAIVDYQIAIELQPDHADARYNLGNIYTKLGRLDDAMKVFQRTLKIQPKNVMAYYNLGTVYKDLGHLNEAINQFERALQINPDFLPALQALESLSQ